MRLKSNPKRIISLALAGCMAVSMVPASAVTAFAEEAGTGAAVTASAENEDASKPETWGTCGAEGHESDVQWAFDSTTGVLSITGNGPMADYVVKDTEDNRPWKQYLNEITKFEIGTGVTKVGDYTAVFCSNLNEIILSDTVKEIGVTAFTSTAITELNVPQSVTKIGNYSFVNCPNLKKVTIHGKTLLDIVPFAGCNIEEFVIADGAEVTCNDSKSPFRESGGNSAVTTLKKVVLNGSLESCNSNQTTTNLWVNMFKDNKELTEIDVYGPSLQYVSETAFPAMETLNVKNGNVELKAVGTQKGYLFSGNNTLKKVDIDVLTYAEDEEYASFRNAQALENFTLKANTVRFGSRTFVECKNLKTIDLTGCGEVSYKEGCLGGNGIPLQTGADYLNSGVKIYVANEAANPRTHTSMLGADCGIVFVTNGGTVDENATGFDSVTKAGYTAKWYEDENFKTETTDTTPQVGKTYYAKWTENASMDANADKKDDSQNATATVGKPVEITVTVNPGDHMWDIWKGKAKITFTDPSAVESLSCNGKTYTGKELADVDYTLSVSDLMPSSGVATYAASATAKMSVVFNKKGNQNIKIELLDSDNNVLCESNTAVIVEEEKKPEESKPDDTKKDDDGKKDDTQPENPVTTYALTVADGTVKVNGKDATANESGAYAVEKDAKVEVTFDKSTLSDAQVFDQWTITPASVLNAVDPKSETISFTMPAEEVSIKAMTRDATIEDDGPGVLGTAAMIGVGVAGTAVLGYQGYMIGTELYLNSVLPAGAAIPNNATELALLVWNDAGKPAPAAVLAADATDEQKALTWAVENQLISADKAADASVTRWEVIQTWNQEQGMKG